MDIRKVKKLIEMLEESNLNEIEIKEGEESVKLVKAQVSSIKEQIVSSVNEAPKVSSTEKQDQKNSEMEKEEKIVGKTVDSPMVGTFYGAPNPGADDFVSVGDKITEGDVLCIIEAMKMMNEVKSDFSGTVKQVLVENAEPVEFGQALFVVE
jgi:acetyl-CoA carboxylase biotin carboxyl carrier protein